MVYRDSIEAAQRRIEVLEDMLADRDEALRLLEAKQAARKRAVRDGWLRHWMMRLASAAHTTNTLRSPAGLLLIPVAVGVCAAFASTAGHPRVSVAPALVAYSTSPPAGSTRSQPPQVGDCAALRSARNMALDAAGRHGDVRSADTRAFIVAYYADELGRRGCGVSGDAPRPSP